MVDPDVLRRDRELGGNLITGRLPRGLHNLTAAYVRYLTHLFAYLSLAANPYPMFTGSDRYPVDLEIDEPAPQRRLITLFRLPLAIPALTFAGVFFANYAGGSYSSGQGEDSAARRPRPSGSCGRSPSWPGLPASRSAACRWASGTYRRTASATARRRGPTSSCSRTGTRTWTRPTRRARARSIRSAWSSRTTSGALASQCSSACLLALPHFVWLILWGIVAFLAGIAGWFAALVIGRLPRPFHRFLSAYLRYSTHLGAFVLLTANLFPGFTGTPGRYPVDPELPEPERQNRLVTLFRLFLAIPAFAVSSSLYTLALVAAFFGWFVSLALGRMPRSFREAQAYALRYGVQTNAYLWLLTGRYPYSGPSLGQPEPEPEPELAPTPVELPA